MQFIWMGLGGALGTVLRFLLQTKVQSTVTSLFPLGTLTVNVVGSAMIGILAGIFETTEVSPQVKLFLFTGLLGGFTTFSAFSLENLTLLKTGHAKLALLYLFTSNVLGIGFAIFGYFFSRVLIK